MVHEFDIKGRNRSGIVRCLKNSNISIRNSIFLLYEMERQRRCETDCGTQCTLTKEAVIDIFKKFRSSVSKAHNILSDKLVARTL